jgi:hypothetical protein
MAFLAEFFPKPKIVSTAHRLLIFNAAEAVAAAPQ